MENKLSITAIILMIVGFTYVGVNMQEPTHYCEAREITAHCEGFSKYYNLENGKCLNKVVGNKLCRTGWQEIPSPVYFTATRNEVTRLHCNSEECK